MASAQAGGTWQRRSATRLAAIQALYALEVSGDPVEAVLTHVSKRNWSGDEPVPPPASIDPGFLQVLVDGVVARRSELDPAIDAALAHGWTTARLEILLQAILRAGAFELAAQPQTPVRVVINEYVEIAHAFFAGREPSLVNAVLDRLAARLRETPSSTVPPATPHREAGEPNDSGSSAAGADRGTGGGTRDGSSGGG